MTLVTFGETMALLTAPRVGPLRHATSLDLGVGGSESNVAIGVRRLGHAAVWAGRVGDDELGRLVLEVLRGQDVDVSLASVDPDAPTGLMLKAPRTAGATQVSYYRTGSAGSRLSPEHLPFEALRTAGVLHVTGITPALSASARETTFAAVEEARGAGVTVSLDPNHRRRLWVDEEARKVLRDLAGLVDVLLAGADEAELITGETETPAQLQALVALGPREVVVKLGADGAVGLVDGEEHRAAGVPVTVVDPVGAGDAFAAGYLSGLLDGLDVADRLALGVRLGAFAVAAHGDWEGLPRRAELDVLDTDDVTR